MSPRPKRLRRMNSIPSFKGFVPVGKKTNLGEAVVLSYDEYEAIKLCDYDGLIQLEASQLMNVSRPTFTRIYESARRKVAKAIIEVLPLQIKGGQVTLLGEWFKCGKCDATFNDPEKEKKKKCPLCRSESIFQINNINDLDSKAEGRGRRRRRNKH